MWASNVFSHKREEIAVFRLTLSFCLVGAGHNHEILSYCVLREHIFYVEGEIFKKLCRDHSVAAVRSSCASSENVARVPLAS